MADISGAHRQLLLARSEPANWRELEGRHEKSVDRKIEALDAIRPNGSRVYAEAVSAQLQLKSVQAELAIFEGAVGGISRAAFSDLEIASFDRIVRPGTSRGLTFTRDLAPLLDKFTGRELVEHIRSLKLTVAELAQKIATSANDKAALQIPDLLRSSAAVIDDPDNPLLLTALEAWLKAQKQQAETARKYRAYVRRLVEFVENIPVRDLRKKQIKAFLDHLLTLPDSNHVPPGIRGKATMAELVEMRFAWLDEQPDAEPDDWPLITVATVNKHLEAIKALLSWVASDQEEFANVAREVKRLKETRAPSDYYVRPFTEDELRTVLAGADQLWGIQTDMWWLIRLAILSGARLEELCQLARENVRIVREVPVIEINGGSYVEGNVKLRRKIKNEMSERLIPIHPWLLKQGFMDYAASGKSTRVFSSLSRSGGRYGHNVTKAFHRLLRENLGLMDRRVRFHSFRHGFITALHNASVTQAQVNSLTGHRRAKGAAGRYIDELDVPVLRAALEKVRPLN